MLPSRGPSVPEPSKISSPFYSGAVEDIVSEARHGTHSRYVIGCRCDDCRAAGSAYSRALRSAAKADDRCVRCYMTRVQAQTQRTGEQRCIGAYLNHKWKP